MLVHCKANCSGHFGQREKTGIGPLRKSYVASCRQVWCFCLYVRESDWINFHMKRFIKSLTLIIARLDYDVRRKRREQICIRSICCTRITTVDAYWIGLGGPSDYDSDCLLLHENQVDVYVIFSSLNFQNSTD